MQNTAAGMALLSPGVFVNSYIFIPPLLCAKHTEQLLCVMPCTQYAGDMLVSVLNNQKN